MEKLSLCRVCLGEDVRLLPIVGTHLQEMYESLVLMPLETTDGRPVLACYICCARLKNCYELRKSCLQSEELFTQMLSSNESEQVKLQGINNKKRLTMDNVIHLSLGHELEMSADNVGVEALKFEVKVEPNDCEDIDEDALEKNSVFDNVPSAESAEDFIIIVKEEQTGDMTIVPTPKASTQDDQRNPEEITTGNLKHHVLVQDTLQDLSRENSTHTAQKSHQCNMCNKSFSSKTKLATHMRTHTGEKPYYCGICKKQFSMKCNLNRHMRTHSGEKLFNCDICKNQFTTKNSLICHIRIHTGEKPYQCHICKKQFTQRVSLEFHMRTHTGDKPYQCHICNRKFSLSGNLNCHIRKNTCWKTIQSDILCNTQFRQSNYSHIAEKQFHCETCKKQFKVMENLIKHMRKHTGEQPHQCSMCNKSFSHLCHLRRHMATHTDKKLV